MEEITEEGPMRPPTILFTDDSRDFILKALGFGVNDDGYMVDENGDIALDQQGEEVKANELGAICKGDSDGTFRIWKNDLLSLMDLADRTRDGKIV